MRWPAALLFCTASCFVTPGYCQEVTPLEAVERHIVSFSPSVFVSPDALPCLGLVISAGRLVMPEECATAARQAMQSGFVTVNDVDGERVGRLPDLSGNPVLQIQAEVMPATQLPFISDQQVLMDEEVYPRFISGQGFVEGGYFVFTGEGGSEWLPLGVSRVGGSGYEFALTTTDSRLGQVGLESLSIGSPVVGERGGVLCLVGSGGGVS